MAEIKEEYSPSMRIKQLSQLETIVFGQHFYLDISVPAIPVRMYSGNMLGDDHFLYDFPRGYNGELITLDGKGKIYHVFSRGYFYLKNENRKGVIIQDAETKLWFVSI